MVATVTPQSFRAAFPAFANEAVYSLGEVEFWLAFAYLRHNAPRWGDLLPMGIMLFTAHNLALEFNARASAEAGQGAGAVVGPLTSVTADKLSWTRNSPSVSLEDGSWGLTTYGTRWRELARMMGAGGIQIGLPGPGDLTPGAWPGVVYPPAWG